jgi:hypothetical protein
MRTRRAVSGFGWQRKKENDDSSLVSLWMASAQGLPHRCGGAAARGTRADDGRKHGTTSPACPPGSRMGSASSRAGSFAVRWAGIASDLFRAASGIAGKNDCNWPRNPGALAGRLRRAQTFLRMLGIEISFTREGRAGTRTIRISAGIENRATIVSAVSAVSTGCHDISIRGGKQAPGLGHSSARERC